MNRFASHSDFSNTSLGAIDLLGLPLL